MKAGTVELILPSSYSWTQRLIVSLFFKNELTFKIACSWDELTGKQLLKVSSLLIDQRGTKLELLVKLIKEITTIPRKYYLLANIEDVYNELLPEADFLLKSPRFEVSPISYFSFRFKKYFAPEESLKNWTVDQFASAETVLDEFITEKKGELLNKLTYIVFRPKEEVYSGLNEVWIGKNIANPKYQAAAFFIYIGMRSLLPELYPNLYTKPVDSSNAISGKTIDWHAILVLACDGDLTRIKGLGRTNLHDFLKLQDERAKQLVKTN